MEDLLEAMDFHHPSSKGRKEEQLEMSHPLDPTTLDLPQCMKGQ
jgi:hypothetical protein